MYEGAPRPIGAGPQICEVNAWLGLVLWYTDGSQLFASVGKPAQGAIVAPATALPSPAHLSLEHLL